MLFLVLVFITLITLKFVLVLDQDTIIMFQFYLLIVIDENCP